MMRYQWHKVKAYSFPALSFGLNLLTALFWVALRVNYSGISKFLGADTNPSFLVMNLPLMVAAATWVSCEFLFDEGSFRELRFDIKRPEK